ncbi:MAG: hypothetical protein AB9888_17965 [Bacteroidales bacterium]
MYLRVPHWNTKGIYLKINGKGMKVSTALGSYLTVSHQCNKGDTVELKMSCRFFLEPFMDQQNIAGRFYGPILLAVQQLEA